MEMKLFMSLEKGFDRLALMRREVIGDHVDLFAARLISHDVSEERDEFGRRVACRGGNTQSHAVRLVLAQAAAPGPCDRAPGWPPSHRRRTPPRAAADAGT